MASGSTSPNLEPVQEDIKDMKIKSGNSSDHDVEDTIEAGKSIKKESRASRSSSQIKGEPTSRSRSPVRRSESTPPYDEAADEDGDDTEVVGGNVILKDEPGQPLKVERQPTKKQDKKPPALFDHYEDATEEAKSTFELLEACTYTAKWLGASGESAMDCDCAEEWDSATKSNAACGDDSDCINRLTKIECVGDCGCGPKCKNQRFQLRQYADISIIKTELKGYGVRANKDLEPGDFIFEYIGEVIKEQQFRKRMIQYDEEGIKHFYFMSLSKGEFVDATKRGNLGRFCNHSCNPNCYVDKWVVGDKLRMGIFAERRVQAGEELVFNYNVDRYGADPQPCHCLELNCTHWIGGKTQSDTSTQLPLATLEALGIDNGDGWQDDKASKQKYRRQKVGEADEQYVDSLQPRSLQEDDATKVMATLMQCKEKWIAIKLLQRIQRCEEDSVRGRVVRMHGYHILKTVLNNFKDEVGVVLQILDVLDSFPKVTRNKIADSKIEDTISTLTEHEDEQVSETSQRLLKEWATLETAYRIPRIKRDPDTVAKQRAEREARAAEARKQRRKERSPERHPRSASPPLHAPKAPAAAPKGPKAQFAPRPYVRPQELPLGKGWFEAKVEQGTYWYTATGQTTWNRPTKDAPTPRRDDTQGLDAIIKRSKEEAKARKDAEVEAKALLAAKEAAKTSKPEKRDKQPAWMSYDEEKKKKVYRGTLAPYVDAVANKYKHKLPKEELKRHHKEILKLISDSDFKKGRVKDPTAKSEKLEKAVRNHVIQFFDKAVVKHKEREKRKAEKAKLAAKEKSKRHGKPDQTSSVSTPVKPEAESSKKDESDDDVVMEFSDDEDVKEEVSKTITPATPFDQLNGDSLKRKQLHDAPENGVGSTIVDASPNKRLRSATPPIPPPPPPPPPEGMPDSAEATPVAETSQNGWHTPAKDAPRATIVSQRELPHRQEQLQEEDERDYGE